MPGSVCDAGGCLAREGAPDVSDTQKAAEPGATQTGAETKPPEQADDSKPMDAAEAKKVRAALHTANEEAKAARIELARVAAEKAAAEKAKATAEGDVVKLREIEQAERKRLQDAHDALKPQADAAARYEQTLKREAEARLAGLPEAQRSFALKLPIEDQLEYARLHSNAQGAAPGARTVGAPGSTQVPVDLSKMSEAQAAAYFRDNPKERKSLLGRLNPLNDPFAGRG